MDREEAIKKLRQMTLPEETGEILEALAPELKESDDERIRKEIKHHISLTEFYRFMTASKEECLAYLEKQKELERIVPEREATDFEIEVHEIIAQARSDKRLADKDVLAQFEQEAACALMWKAEKQKERGPLTNEEEYTLQRIIEHLEDEGCPQSWKDLLYDIYNLPYEKQKEQKPAEWSEEDEKMLRTIISDGIRGAGLDSKQFDWLKSLRPSWRPSEEQEEPEYYQHFDPDC